MLAFRRCYTGRSVWGGLLKRRLGEKAAEAGQGATKLTRGARLLPVIAPRVLQVVHGCLGCAFATILRSGGGYKKDALRGIRAGRMEIRHLSLAESAEAYAPREASRNQASLVRSGLWIISASRLTRT